MVSLKSRFGLMSVFAMSLLGLSACSHIKTESIPSTANPSEEISKLEADRNEAFQKQINVLSPTNFAKADEALKEAKEKRDAGYKNEEILKYVAESRAYLKQANQVGDRAQPALSEVLKARDAALAANAPKYAPGEIADLDKDLKKVARKIEDNNLKDVHKERAELQAKYLSVELRSLKKGYLGYAKELLHQAVKEGAKDSAPRTLQSTQGFLNDVEAQITVDRRNLPEIEKQASLATQNAERLLKITREAKTARKKDGEQVALEVEEQAIRADKNAETANTLAVANADAANQLASANEKLSADQIVKRNYEYAYKQFSKDEAEVLQDSNRVLIRLKKLNFPVGKDVIVTENYPLLRKVQDVIKNFGDSKVVVEGHTDSSGTKAKNISLSESRAEAVKQYLISNDAIAESKISSVGYGYTKPLASNKTTAGRNQNRRVDIIIAPETAADRSS